MHKYLRSIGFSKYCRHKEIRELLKKTVRFADSKKYVSGDNEVIWAEYRKEFAPGLGLAVCGEYTEENEFEPEYYFPYFDSELVSSRENLHVDENLYNEAYLGIYDDDRVGVSIIFYLQNRMDYLKEYMRDNIKDKPCNISLSGMCSSGTIMLPLCKDEALVKRNKSKSLKRNSLIAKAREGDEQAMESLTLEDIDIYNTVTKKVFKSDIFTVVDTCFMPAGSFCESYSILGEIESSRLVKNSLTGEDIYIMGISCNDLNFNVCINKVDLLGEPAPRRRFKGIIWLQGHVDFE